MCSISYRRKGRKNARALGIERPRLSNRVLLAPPLGDQGLDRSRDNLHMRDSMGSQRGEEFLRVARRHRGKTESIHVHLIGGGKVRVTGECVGDDVFHVYTPIAISEAI